MHEGRFTIDFTVRKGSGQETEEARTWALLTREVKGLWRVLKQN
jgi:hypothetical protein